MGLFSGIGKMIGGFAKRGAARRAQRAARAEKDAHTNTLKSLESSRQAVVNPYDSVKDQSGKLSNPFASLGVSTAAADMQAEQTDVALANTLDTIRSTGGGAGGATALAQAALQSKKGVAASIEKQEVQNQKLAADGQARQEQIQMQEKQRVQSLQISEGQRMQTQEAAGQQYMMTMTENRSNSDLGRAAGQEQQAMANEAAANQAVGQAWGAAFSGAAGSLTAGIKAQAGIDVAADNLKAAELEFS